MLTRTGSRWKSPARLLGVIICGVSLLILVRLFDQSSAQRHSPGGAATGGILTLSAEVGKSRRTGLVSGVVEKPVSQRLAASNPAYHEVVNGTEVLILNITQPKAVLLVFHGCSHAATDWWYRSSTCPLCKGLPEEVAVTKLALKKRWAVVAFSSSDQYVHQCWDSRFPPEESSDTLPVIRAFDAIAEREGWAKLPRYALGGSSGGAFALHLALRLPLSGLAVQLMAVMPENLESAPHTLGAAGTGHTWAYPSTAFVHMSRDEHTAERVQLDVAVLKKQGVQVMEAAVPPLALTPGFMAQRVDDFGQDQSHAVYDALRDGGALNETGYLISDPRSSEMLSSHVSLFSLFPRSQRAAADAAVAEDSSSCTVIRKSRAVKCWASRLHHSKTTWQSLVASRVPGVAVEADGSALAEELNVAWGYHELVSDPMDQVFDWLSAHSSSARLMAAVKP